MKKVFHLISSLIKGDGPSSGILAQVTAQDRSEFQSAIWSLYPPPPDRDPHVAVAQAGARNKVFSMGRSFLDVRILIPLVRQLRQDRPDILHCHLVRANLYGRIAAKLAGVSVVISTLRNIEDYMQKQNVTSRAVRQAERLTARWVSKYVAVSDNVRCRAIEYLRIEPDQIITILNAVDLSLFNHLPDERAAIRAEIGLHSDDIVIGSVGRLHRQKNYPFLIRLAKILSVYSGKVRFVIIGDGEERSTLETMIAGLGLDNIVILTGFRSDIPRVLQAFDVFVLLSLYEGLPRAVMEAMATGLPCVVTDVGGNVEAVVHGENGFVWPVGDIANVADSLQQLIGDPELRQKMGQSGRERAHRLFGADRMVQQYNELYKALLKQAVRTGAN